MGAVAKAQTFWRSAVEGIRHQPFVHAVSTVTLAIALFTLGLARSAAHELDRLVGSLGGEVRVTVYLDPRATPEARTAIRAVAGYIYRSVMLIFPYATFARGVMGGQQLPRGSSRRVPFTTAPITRIPSVASR